MQVAVDASSGLVGTELGVRVGERWLLRGVNLRLQAGQVGVVLGPNGAGKSTLLSVLAGLAAPQEGSVGIDGQPVDPGSAARWAARRAVLPQDTAVAFDFSARDVVALGRYPHRLHPSRQEDRIVADALSATDVAHLANRGVGHLSGGERLRVQLARVLAQIWEAPADGASRWLLLDEPTAALDLQHQHEVLGLVHRWAREQGVGVLVVLHDLNLALRYADRVWVLQGGRLRATGAPEAVLTPALLESVWRVRATPVAGPDGCAQLLVDAGAPGRR
ncbi:MAG: heme ABC transporter ATP-binding protein [Burkholderiales bacterium]|nr:MAG: heme ABC transporter ATP-binding protein [Burkholderiales bacterium]